MTLFLKKVEISNIRSHKHFVFEPAEEGITAISGENGTGKSTIVDSISWTLWGTKPQGVSKAAAIMREGSVFGKDKSFVKLEMIVSGREIRVERRFISKAGATECEVWEKTTDDKWVSIAGPSVSHAEPQLRKLLSMDEAGFLAAILVQQKQVDKLISATPPERAKVIEKLTGIASITAALQEARQEHNSIKKLASFSNIDETLLEKLKKEHASLRDTLHKKTAELNKLMSEEKELKKTGIALKEEVEEGESALNAAAEAKEKLVALKATIKAQEDEAQRLNEERKAKKEKISNLASSASFEEVNAQEKALREKQVEITEKLFACKNQLLELSELEVKYTEVVEISRIKDLPGAEKGKKAQEAKLNLAKQKITAAKESITALTSKDETIQSAISIIRDSHGECPTCLQTVKDVSAAVKGLEEESAQLKEKVAENEAQITKLEDSVVSIDKAVEKFDLLIESIEGLESLKNKEKEANASLSDLTSEQKVNDKELKTIRKIQADLEAERELNEEYQRLYRRVQTLMEEIDGKKKTAVELEHTASIKINARDLAKKKTQLEESRSKYTAISTKVAEEKGEVRLLTEQKKNTLEKIEAQENEIKKHKELLKKVEVASASNALIAEFRKNRIESSVPLIESYASDLLSRFTEGKFTRLKLDSKFAATVILANGVERAVGLLSGGELSAAAMSLRLAISMLLNGGASQNLIVLDEVLVSQDNVRAELILETIKDVCKGQVVLIAHNDSINEISDKTVQLS